MFRTTSFNVCVWFLQMKITYDDQYLVTVSEDACVMIWKIQDKEGRGIKRDKEVGYAEEILITKSDLEEKVSHKALLTSKTTAGRPHVVC